MWKKMVTPIVMVVATFLAFAGLVSAQGHTHGSHGTTPMPKTEPKQETKMFAAPTEFKAQLDSVFIAYFTVQGALSRDSLAEAKKGAALVQAGLKKVDMRLLEGEAHMKWMERAKAIRENAGVVAGAEDLRAAREAFHALSGAFVLTAHEFGAFGARQAYVLHCPMAFNNKGADWLQDKSNTENPYFGKSMFACGNVTETLPGGKTE